MRLYFALHSFPFNYGWLTFNLGWDNDPPQFVDQFRESDHHAVGQVNRVYEQAKYTFKNVQPYSFLAMW